MRTVLAPLRKAKAMTLSSSVVIASDGVFGTVHVWFVVGCVWIFEVDVGCGLVTKTEATDSFAYASS